MASVGHFGFLQLQHTSLFETGAWKYRVRQQKWNKVTQQGIVTLKDIISAIIHTHSKKLSFFTNVQGNKAFTAVANLADRPFQEESDDTDLVEESEPTGLQNRKRRTR